MDNLSENVTSCWESSKKNAATKVGEEIGSRALNGILGFLANKYGQTQVLTKSVFQTYSYNAYRRYNRVKTLATGREPRPIIGRGNTYVKIGVSYNGREISTATADNLLDISKNIIIEGTGGVGKSMLMRYLFLNSVNRGNYIPVLLEMRKVSTQTSSIEVSIMELIYMCMEEFDVKLPREQFEYSLRHGGYLFLFDGLDEVKENKYIETADAIQKFSAKYPKNSYIITSRPGRNFSPLETFTIMLSLPLSKAQALQLSLKFCEPSEKSMEFCRQVEEDLFEKHKSFLENPLLLSIMFLTFMRNNSIPDHLADFYEKAYEALYSTHDNSKGAFKRDFCCKLLDERGFKMIFAHFCFHSYYEELYEFDNSNIEKRLNKSIQKNSLKSKVLATKYLSDLQNIVCLVVEDGGKYCFSHRSFQTYFAAYYTSQLSDEQQKHWFKAYFKSSASTEASEYFQLLYQIEGERFVENALENPIRQIYAEARRTTHYSVDFLLRIGINCARVVDTRVTSEIVKTSIYPHSFTQLSRKEKATGIQNGKPTSLDTVLCLFLTYVSNDWDTLNASRLRQYRPAMNIPKHGSPERWVYFNRNQDQDPFCLMIADIIGTGLVREIRRWIERLNAHRKALESSDFIDML